MKRGINKVILIGNLGRDPEIRSFNNGDRVANLSIATSESWRDKSTGERKEKTEWHRVVIMNENIVKVVEQYVSKGSTVYIVRRYGKAYSTAYTATTDKVDVYKCIVGAKQRLAHEANSVFRATVPLYVQDFKQDATVAA